MAGHGLDSPILRRAAVVAGLCLAIAPAAASVDSLVFVKSGNVWLSQPDGSGALGGTRWSLALGGAGSA